MIAPALLTAALLAQAAPQPPAGSRDPALNVAPRSTVDPASPGVAPPPGAGVLTLEDAMREAEGANLDLRQTRARLDAARAGIRRAWSGYLPQVRASATATHNSAAAEVPADVFGPEPIVIQKQNQLSAVLDANQALLAPSVWYGVSSARLGSDLAENALEVARRDLLFGVVQAYYGAVALKKAIAVNERQLAIALQHEKDARIRFQVGTVPKITLLRAEIDRSRADQDLTRARNSHAGAKLALATLLDRKDASFDVDVPAPAPLPPDRGALKEAALRDRPEVQAASTNVELQRANRLGVLSRYVPSLGAFGRYQLSNSGGFTGEKDAWAVGLSASWAIFDGGLREADLRENRARIAEAEAALRSAENRVREEVARAELDLESAIANRVKAEEQLQLARENQRLVEVNFRAGAATYLEVSDANAALLAADLGAVNESLNADLAAVRLLRAAGRFAAPR